MAELTIPCRRCGEPATLKAVLPDTYDEAVLPIEDFIEEYGLKMTRRWKTRHPIVWECSNPNCQEFHPAQP